MDHKILLGYWKVRGRAEVARQLLALSGAEWEEKHYEGEGQEWFGKDKNGLGLLLPNLPYFIEGDFNLTESSAIYKHILRKFGKREYLGRTINEQALVDSLISLQYDVDELILHLFWDPKWKEKVQQNLKKAGPKLRKVNQLYGTNTYALGYPTLPDFLFAEMSYYVEKIAPELYKELPFLARLRETINSIPEISAYYAKKGSLPFVQEGDLTF